MDKKVNEKSQNTSKGKYGISVVLKTIFIVLIALAVIFPFYLMTQSGVSPWLGWLSFILLIAVPTCVGIYVHRVHKDNPAWRKDHAEMIKEKQEGQEIMKNGYKPQPKPKEEPKAKPQALSVEEKAKPIKSNKPKPVQNNQPEPNKNNQQKAAAPKQKHANKQKPIVKKPSEEKPQPKAQPNKATKETEKPNAQPQQHKAGNHRGSIIALAIIVILVGGFMHMRNQNQKTADRIEHQEEVSDKKKEKKINREAKINAAENKDANKEIKESCQDMINRSQGQITQIEYGYDDDKTDENYKGIDMLKVHYSSDFTDLPAEVRQTALDKLQSSANSVFADSHLPEPYIECIDEYGEPFAESNFERSAIKVKH